MASSEKFCLRWNDFESNISGAFRELREDKDFFDITLACDDEQVEAHKLILSACSPFFRTVLKRNKHQHPLLYLKGVRYHDLVAVLNFMYHGEVNVAQEELNSFLAVAEDLKVKGLTQNGSSSSKTSDLQPRKPAAPPPPTKKSYPPPTPAKPAPAPAYQTSAYHEQSDDEIQEVVPIIKSEPVSQSIQEPPPAAIPTYHSQPTHQSQQHQTHHSTTLSLPQSESHALAATEDYTDYEEYDAGLSNTGYDESMQIPGGDDANKELDDLITRSIIRYEDPVRGPVWQCGVCKKENKDKAQIKRHVETHISGFRHSCYICMKEFKSRESLRIHSYTHRQR